MMCLELLTEWSGRRDSNPRQPAGKAAYCGSRSLPSWQPFLPLGRKLRVLSTRQKQVYDESS